ncbi:MAG: trypsin-like peptidase domain-containing protein, partial [Acetobacteraceae bacterium]|nr:trypsin-like peptidase domain-containing protein [Acetobacteraceae bacterium]MDW8398788.1 trypsin-like peptidase domain-containing protein [Acetobacteraceae bacterium]
MREDLAIALPRRALLLGPPALVIALARPARAQRNALLPDFADLAERVLPSVVSISVQAERPAQLPPELRGTPYERLFRDRRVTTSAGSGFIVEPGTLIVTNHHVIQGASRIQVTFQAGGTAPASVVGSDELTDIAVLRVDRAGGPPVTWGSSAAVRVGQWVMAAGNPFGLGGTVTVGIVSALGRDIEVGPFDAFIQTDAAINPGNSGGPLFNLAGEVIGINTAIFSTSGASAGIGFATPSDLARGVVEQIRRGGSVARGWLGVVVADLPPAPGRRGGALIEAVERTGPAARAGL